MKKKEQQSYIILNAHGPEIKVPIRHSSKAKHHILKFGLRGIELVIPSNSHNKIPHEFLKKHELWVRNKQMTSYTSKKVFEQGEILLFGKLYNIISNTGIMSNRVYIEDDSIIIEGSEKDQSILLARFLEEQLFIVINKLAEEASKYYSLNYKGISIRDNSKCWGSCSSKKNLSFSLKLCFAPIDIIKYVVIHEVCHLKEMNHSKNFWNLVKKLCPDYKQSISWLKQNGKTWPAVKNLLFEVA